MNVLTNFFDPHNLSEKTDIKQIIKTHFKPEPKFTTYVTYYGKKTVYFCGGFLCEIPLHIIKTIGTIIIECIQRPLTDYPGIIKKVTWISINQLTFCSLSPRSFLKGWIFPSVYLPKVTNARLYTHPEMFEKLTAGLCNGSSLLFVSLFENLKEIYPDPKVRILKIGNFFQNGVPEEACLAQIDESLGLKEYFGVLCFAGKMFFLTSSKLFYLHQLVVASIGVGLIAYKKKNFSLVKNLIVAPSNIFTSSIFPVARKYLQIHITNVTPTFKIREHTYTFWQKTNIKKDFSEYQNISSLSPGTYIINAFKDLNEGHAMVYIKISDEHAYFFCVNRGVKELKGKYHWKELMSDCEYFGWGFKSFNFYKMERSYWGSTVIDFLKMPYLQLKATSKSMLIAHPLAFIGLARSA